MVNPSPTIMGWGMEEVWMDGKFRKWRRLTFIQCCLWARHCAGCFRCVVSYNHTVGSKKVE